MLLCCRKNFCKSRACGMWICFLDVIENQQNYFYFFGKPKLHNFCVQYLSIFTLYSLRIHKYVHRKNLQEIEDGSRYVINCDLQFLKKSDLKVLIDDYSINCIVNTKLDQDDQGKVNQLT